jgi:hypothetical protein
VWLINADKGKPDNVSRAKEIEMTKQRTALLSLMGVIVVLAALTAKAQNSAFVREIDLEQARANDFHRHEIEAEKYELKRVATVEVYKASVARQATAEDKAREAYIVERNRRQKGLSDEELDVILRKAAERQEAAYEERRAGFVKLRNQIEAAHHHRVLNENEEYGL